MLNRILKSPLSILLGAVLGILIGIYDKSLALNIQPWGDLYFTALKMTVIPFVFASISVSMANFTRDKHSMPYIKKVIIFFSVFLVLTAAISVYLAVVFQPGVLSDAAAANMVEITGAVSAENININQDLNSGESRGILSFLVNAVPANIFNAFSKGQMFQIIVFSIILGAAIGLLDRRDRDNILPMIDSFKTTIQRIISALITFLPLGVLVVFAKQATMFNATVVSTLFTFVTLSVVVFLISYFLSIIVLRLKSGLSILTCMNLTKESFFIVISTGSSFVALPKTEDVMVNNMKFSKKLTSLIMPLGLVLCRYSYVTYFAFAALFISQIYSVPLSYNDLLFVVFGAVVASIASSGAPSGLLALPFISIITDPLGLPYEAALPLLLAVDPIFEPFRSAVVLFNNMAVSAIITGQDKNDKSGDEIKKNATKSKIETKRKTATAKKSTKTTKKPSPQKA